MEMSTTKTETSIAIELIVKHYDNDEKGFRSACYDLANLYDQQGRNPQLAEYIIAQFTPAVQFVPMQQTMQPTCSIVSSCCYDKFYLDIEEIKLSCGHEIMKLYEMNYCPVCGAKVVK